MNINLGQMMGFMLILLAGVFIVGITIYILIAIFLNKFNKLVYGKGTPFAWIPICNIFLLGRLTINDAVGWILVLCSFLTSTYTSNVNGKKVIKTLLPTDIYYIVAIIYSIVVFILLIYAIIKYFKIKNEKSNYLNQPVEQNNIVKEEDIKKEEIVQEEVKVEEVQQEENKVIEEKKEEHPLVDNGPSLADLYNDTNQDNNSNNI